MPMHDLRQDLRGLPPFAKAYVRYTRRLGHYVLVLSRAMTLADVAGVVGLSWDTVKDIVQPQLRKAVTPTRFKGLKHLAIDEIYVGKKRKFYTLVIDLDTGESGDMIYNKYDSVCSDLDDPEEPELLPEELELLKKLDAEEK